MKNLQAYMETLGAGQNDSVSDKSKSMKMKSRSHTFRSLMRQSSNRFFPTTVPAAERQENSEGITPNVGDEAV
jgi:hypothetical protein